MSDQFSRNYRNQQMAMNNQLKDLQGNATLSYNQRISKITRKFDLEKENVLDNFENLKQKKEQAAAILGTVGGLIENSVLSRHLIQSGAKNYIKSRKELNSIKKQRNVDIDPEEIANPDAAIQKPTGGDALDSINRNFQDAADMPEGVLVPREKPITGFGDFGAETKLSRGAVPRFDFRDPTGEDSMNAMFSSGNENIPPAPRFKEYNKIPGIKYKLSGDQQPTFGQRFQRTVKGIKSNIQKKFDDIKSKFRGEPIEAEPEPAYPDIPFFKGTQDTFEGFAAQREALAARGDFTRGGGLAQKVSSSGRKLRSQYPSSIEMADFKPAEIDEPIQKAASVLDYPGQDTLESFAAQRDALAGRRDFSRGRGLALKFSSSGRQLKSEYPSAVELSDFKAPLVPDAAASLREDPLLSRLKALAPQPEGPGTPLDEFAPPEKGPVSIQLGDLAPKPLGFNDKGIAQVRGVASDPDVGGGFKLNVGSVGAEAEEAAAEAGGSIAGKIGSTLGGLGEIGGIGGAAYGTVQAFKGKDPTSKGLAVGQDIVAGGGVKKLFKGGADAAGEAADTAGDIGADVAGTAGDVAADVGGAELAGLGIEAGESVVPVVGEGLALATGIGFTIAGLVKGAVDLANQAKNPASKVEQQENRTLDTQQNSINTGGRFVAPNQVSIYNQSQHFQGF